MICSVKHPTSKFNVKFLNINARKRQGRAGQGVKDGKTAIKKDSSDNIKCTPKLKERSQELHHITRVCKA